MEEAFQPWIVDTTFRPKAAEPEIEVEPDGTIELSFERRTESGVGALTLLLSQEQFAKIIDRGLELRVMGLVRQVADGD